MAVAHRRLGRAENPYFRLLVRDPDILGARTRTDNGCIFCPSVHSRFTTTCGGKGRLVHQLPIPSAATGRLVRQRPTL